MPSHTHVQDPHRHEINFGYPQGGDGSAFTYATRQGQSNYSVWNTTATNQPTGGGGSHNNIQPTVAALLVIKT